ncbi:HAD-IIIC family phosphatase [Solihabitans fulvus]|uniref:HAD-IIIC family phosphatase n=1 Tax=Solihabitans fulvus TaxID=1892852 RepID=UPI001661D1D1|nr:HAD-IIIC family phosphatase [Solihabitans fulvus]
MAPLFAPLTVALARDGLLLRTGAAAAAGATTVHLLDAFTIFRDVPNPWQVEDVRAALRRTLAGLPAGPRVLNTVPLPRALAHQLVDHASRAALGIAWREFTIELLRLGERPDTTVIDLDVLLTDTGPLDDARTRLHANLHFGEEVLAVYAIEVAAALRAGRGRKVLVLDLDGTLWGGVLGDDGPDGIDVGGPGAGLAFTEVQRVARQLAAQGVLLAVCSKNDAELVAETLRTHPDLTLRDTDFVAVLANWEPKDRNLVELADRVGLALDSFVFLDDSPFERAVVRGSLPEVAVVDLSEDPAEHVSRLLAGGWFTVPSVTEEDRARSVAYRATARSLAEHLTDLDTEVEVFRPTAVHAARLAQLSQRTNQFNLTGIRLDEAAVTTRLGDLVAVRVRDRHGEHGLVGAVLTRRDGDVLTLENALLSCRVFDRQVETAFLRAVLAHAADTGITEVRGDYRPTARNRRFADFYPRHGFRAVGEHYRHDLAELPPGVPHINLGGNL